MTGVSGVSAVVAAVHFGLFLTSSCELWGTGFNVAAQLGTGDTTNHDAPVRATAVSP